MNNFLNYWPEFISSIVLSVVLTGLIRNYALNKKILSPVRARDVHTNPVPRLGGIAIFATFWLIVLAILIFDRSALNFNSNLVMGLDAKLFGVLIGSILIFGVGLLDDRYDLHYGVKLCAQIIAAMIVVYFGISISTLSNPFGEIFNLGSIGIVFVAIWMVIMMNAVNWMDGLDGLASGVVAIGTFILGCLAMSKSIDQPQTALLAFVLFGAILGFLPWNFHPAKIFLGDNGSLFLGFMIAVLAVISGGKVATAGLVLGLPLLDFGWVVMRRVLSGHSPFLADKLHLHHRLLEAGFSTRQAVVFLYFISAVFGLIALNGQTYEKFQAGVGLILVILILGVLLVYGPKWKRKFR